MLRRFSFLKQAQGLYITHAHMLAQCYVIRVNTPLNLLLLLLLLLLP